MLDKPIHVLAFAGSLRQDSYNKALLRVAQENLPSGMTMEIFDLAPLPFFNADVERIATPDPVLAFRERMKAADALLISTPEYNYSIPAVLKNALDWASRRGPDAQAPLDDLPVAIMGAGGRFGTIRAQDHLRDILLHNRNFVVPSPQVMIATAYKEFADDGTLTNERYQQQIAQLLSNLQQWTVRLKVSEPLLVTG